MRIRYFAGTDTLYIEFRSAAIAETRDLDENTLLDVDADGNARFPRLSPADFAD